MKRASKGIAAMCQRSRFATTIMREVAEFATAPTTLSRAELLEALKEYALLLFQGWDQTKIIEDGIQRLRGRTSADVRNARIGIGKQLLVLAYEGS